MTTDASPINIEERAGLLRYLREGALIGGRETPKLRALEAQGGF